MAQQKIQWTFNPSLAPHFGGFRKRLIQAAERSLLIVLGSRKLTLSVFQTVVAEADSILNSRPLTYVGWSISDEGSLTPIHFLLPRPHMCLKPLVNNNQQFSTKDFKSTQKLYNQYWNRLLNENVPGLNKRTEWQKSHDELDEINIVWVLKDFTPEPLVKIVKAHRGSDWIVWSFDIKAAIGIVQRPAVNLNRVFPILSNDPEVHWNKFFVLQKTQNPNKNFCALFYCVYHLNSIVDFLPGVWRNQVSLCFLSPHIFFPAYIFVLQNPLIAWFPSPNLFPLMRFIFVDFNVNVTSGWYSLPIIFFVRIFSFLTILCPWREL